MSTAMSPSIDIQHGSTKEIATTNSSDNQSYSFDSEKQNNEILASDATRTESSVPSEKDSQRLRKDGLRPWKTLFFRYGPLSGIGCMLVVPKIEECASA